MKIKIAEFLTEMPLELKNSSLGDKYIASRKIMPPERFKMKNRIIRNFIQIFKILIFNFSKFGNLLIRNFYSL